MATTLATLFGIFFKIGLFTIGGGYAMIPMIKEEIIAQGWMDLSALIDFIAIAESTPGPFAINIATYVGTIVGGEGGILWGILGALLTTIGVALPSFIIILLIAKYFYSFKDNRVVSAALSGIRPAVVGLIAAACFVIALGVFAGEDSFASLLGGKPVTVEWQSLLIGITAFGFTFWKKKWHPIVMIGISAAMGVLLFGVLPLL